MMFPRLHVFRGIDEGLLLAAIDEGAADTAVGAGTVAADTGAVAAGTAGTAAGSSALTASTAGSLAASGAAGAASSAVAPSASIGSGAGMGFFGNAAISAVLGTAGNTATQALMGRRSGISIPPPPGAAMIDPEGAQAAAQVRQRVASAGGLNSTVTGAGAGPTGQAAYSSATSGGKSLLGQ